MGPIGTVRRSFLSAGYSRGKVEMQLKNIKRVGNDKETLTGLLTVKHGSDQVTESATVKWSSSDEGFKVVSSGVSTIIDDQDSISVVLDMSDLGLEKTLNLKLDESVNLSSSTTATDELSGGDDATESHLETEEATTTTYEFDFSIADSDDINVTWYDADTTQDPVTSSLATLKTDNGTLGSAIFAAALDDDHGNTAFISSETNFIVDVPGSQTAGTSAIVGILEAEEDGDSKPRVVKDSIRGTIRETIMATINDVTYTFNRTLAIANFQLTYDPTRADDFYPNIVYQTPSGDKLTVSINYGNMRNYTFELTE